MQGKLKYGREDIMDLVLADAQKRMSFSRKNVREANVLQIEFINKVTNKNLCPNDIEVNIYVEHVETPACI